MNLIQAVAASARRRILAVSSLISPPRGAVGEFYSVFIIFF